MNMYPYCSPTGAGYTPNKAYADRMEELRAEYIEACKDKDTDAQIEIRDREKNLSFLINDVAARLRQGMEPYAETPARECRTIRVTAYAAHERDSGTMNKKTIINDFTVILDTAEIEATSTQARMPMTYTIHMRSGQKWDVGEEDFNKVNQFLYSRKS